MWARNGEWARMPSILWKRVGSISQGLRLQPAPILSARVTSRSSAECYLLSDGGWWRERRRRMEDMYKTWGRANEESSLVEGANPPELHSFYICKMELILALPFFLGLFGKSPNTHLFLKLCCPREAPKSSQNYTRPGPFTYRFQFSRSGVGLENLYLETFSGAFCYPAYFEDIYCFTIYSTLREIRLAK